MPQGFICIHIERKKCYAVRGTQGAATSINLRSGLHFLRNYAMESAGILFSPNQGGTVALVEAGSSPLRDNARHRSASHPNSTCVVARFHAISSLVVEFSCGQCSPEENHDDFRAPPKIKPSQVQAPRALGGPRARTGRRTRVTRKHLHCPNEWRAAAP